MLCTLWLALAWAQTPAEPIKVGSAQPTEHTLIYYNARMALREGEPLEATRLWLLRNAFGDQTGQVSPHDPDFHSVTWAALGELGICQDGHPTDEDGAGLWPIAMHNWVVLNRGRRAKSKPPRPFDSFELGRQQRLVSIGDVLSGRELGSVKLFRGGCTRPRLAMVGAGLSVTGDLADRQVSAGLMQHLLERARGTLDPENVRGTATIDARLFDIYLQQAALGEREARRRASAEGRRGREIGMSRESVLAMRDDAPGTTISESSEAGRILRECQEWSASEWMALSPDRRLFLYDKARHYQGDTQALDNVALAVIDSLIARGDGSEVDRWIAHRGSADLDHKAIWGGDRGQGLLALDRESGFHERAAIALHRGVHQLEQGDLPGALRSMAYASQAAPESSAAEDVQSLSLRWLSYVASRFEITDELLITIQELVARRDYAVILEDLMWSAAFRADDRSFQLGVKNQTGHGALSRRIDHLVPLARGDAGAFAGRMGDGLDRSPSETLRFLDQMVQRLELEDGDVRTAHVVTLEHVRRLLSPLSDASASGRQSRTANSLMERTQAIIEGLDGLGPQASSRDRARSLDPSGEVFAGSVRLAPSDPLPWPFRAADVPPPSIYTQINLTPLEWRDGAGELVFGWTIDGGDTL